MLEAVSGDDSIRVVASDVWQQKTGKREARRRSVCVPVPVHNPTKRKAKLMLTKVIFELEFERERLWDAVVILHTGQPFFREIERRDGTHQCDFDGKNSGRPRIDSDIRDEPT